jgi:hypothetical protein
VITFIRRAVFTHLRKAKEADEFLHTKNGYQFLELSLSHLKRVIFRYKAVWKLPSVPWGSKSMRIFTMIGIMLLKTETSGAAAQDPRLVLYRASATSHPLKATAAS